MHLQEVDPRNRKVRRDDADVEPDPRPSLASRYVPGASDHPVELAVHRLTMIACLVTVLAALAIMPARARFDTTASPGADSLVEAVVPPTGASGIRRFPEARSGG